MKLKKEFDLQGGATGLTTPLRFVLSFSRQSKGIKRGRQDLGTQLCDGAYLNQNSSFAKQSNARAFERFGVKLLRTKKDSPEPQGSGLSFLVRVFITKLLKILCFTAFKTYSDRALPIKNR